MWDHVLDILNSYTSHCGTGIDRDWYIAVVLVHGDSYFSQPKQPAKEEVISLDQKTGTLAIQHVSEVGKMGPKVKCISNCMVHTHTLTDWQRLSPKHCEGSSCHNPRTRTTEDFWSKELAWPQALHTEVFDVPKSKAITLTIIALDVAHN